MGAITEIFRTFAPEYLQRFPNLPQQHRKVIDAIINCRSGSFGVTVYRCEGCGEKHYLNRCCGNRHCPQCQYQKSRDWLEKQLDRRLPGQHFMLTFTLPKELRQFCRSNQRVAYGALFAAAAHSLKKLARDPRHIGCDLSGFTGVLHTWGRQVQYHPHVHFIVPAGGLSKNRDKWLPSGNVFYLPVRALSKIFKARFKAEMAKSDLLAAIDPKVWKMCWNVNCQPVGDSEASYKYLAPYVFRVAISDSRIVALQGREVTFSYRKRGSKRLRKTTLDAIEFISRYLQHVLPLGFVKVRHFGFMSSGCNVALQRIRLYILTALQKISSLTEISLPRKKKSISRPFCRSCGARLLYMFSIIPGAPCRGST